MITEAKNLLEEIVKKRVPGVTVARSLAEEQKAYRDRKFPLVALITSPGPFSEKEAQTVRYFDENKKYQQRYVRGNRNLPIQIRCWAEGEEAADKAFSCIIPAIPSRWTYDDFTGSIEIGTEEHSDHAGNTSKLYLSVIDVRFCVAAAMEPGELPYYDNVVLEGAEIAKPK